MSGNWEFSDALSQLGAAAVISRPHDRRALAKLAPPGCAPRWVEAAELLLQLTSGRGLPVLGDYDFGVLADFDCSPRQRRSDLPGLVIARHASGRPVVLASRDGAVYVGRFEQRLGASLRIFLERLAAERFPAPAVYGFRIHNRSRDDARKLANKIRVVENFAASSEHDHCWSDERWFVVQDRIAARSFDDLPTLLAAAEATGVEIGLHDGRADALLVEVYQPVPEEPQYHMKTGIGELSICATADRRIEQALHYGDIGTEWAEWSEGELLVQRKRPIVELFKPNPDLQEYLDARRIQRVDCFRRTEEHLRRLYGADLWPVLASLERDYGGLIAEDDLTYWALFHIKPLVAPGFMAETAPERERVGSIQGEQVHRVGTVRLDHQLCVDARGRFYITDDMRYDIEAGGDDLESTLLRLALDWKYERWRTDACLGGFLDPQDAARWIGELRGAIERKLDTFGHAYYEGQGFVLRHPKAVLGQKSFFHLVASSAKRFSDVLRPLTASGQPIKVEQDNLSFPTDEEIALCARSGVLLAD